MDFKTVRPVNNKDKFTQVVTLIMRYLLNFTVLVISAQIN